MASRSSRTVRSPSFPTFDRSDLWIERTRDLASSDMQRSVIEGEINAMSDEEVTAALASLRVGIEEEDVLDPLLPETAPAATAPATEIRSVTVEDVNSDDGDSNGHNGAISDDDDDPTNRYSLPEIPAPRPTSDPTASLPRVPRVPDLPVEPYVSPRRVRYDEFPRISVPRDFARESTTESVRARRTPIPTIESQTKPPTKFKGEEMSFLKVDVFLNKMERYLRAGHGLDLSTEDIGDYIYDSLDGYAYRWFHTIPKQAPYLYRHFDRDLRQRYVPVNYKDQLADEYEAVKQGDDRLFTDYLTELRDYEDMLADVTLRDRYRVLKKGLNDDLRRSMIVFEGVPYAEFVNHATRIDPALLKKRQERAKKPSATTVSKDSKSSSQSGTQPSSQSSSSRRFRPTSSSKRSYPARKPAIKELKPEISRQEHD